MVNATHNHENIASACSALTARFVHAVQASAAASTHAADGGAAGASAMPVSGEPALLNRTKAWLNSVFTKETVCAIASAVDTYNATRAAVKDDGDDRLQPMLETGWEVATAFPGVVEVLGGFGAHAPLVGVAFSVLSAAAAHWREANDVRDEFEQLVHRVMDMMETVLAVELVQKSRSVELPAPVEAKLEAFWESLEAVVRMHKRFNAKGWFSRMWDKSADAAALKGLRDQIGHAHNELMRAQTLVTGITTEETRTIVLRVEAALARHGSDLTLIREVLGRIETTLSPALSPLVDVGKYAAAIVCSFGAALQLTDAMPIESAGDTGVHREPELGEVFLPQDVQQCDDVDVSILELPEELVKELSEKGALMDYISRHRDAYRRINTQRTMSVVDLLNDTSTRLAVILGDPGAGKSSALRYHALNWATAPAAGREALALPILVELKQFAQWLQGATDGSLLHYIATGGSVSSAMNEAALVARCASDDPRITLLLDGLDEVFDDVLRNLVLRQVRLLTDAHGTSLRIVMTSRIVGYAPSDLPKRGFQHFHMQQFTDDQILKFIDKWHARSYTDAPAAIMLRDNRAHRLHTAIRTKTAIRRLARNPLLLTMIAIVNRGPELPTKRVRLYDKCAELLIGQWKAHEALEKAGVFGKQLSSTPFGYDEKRALLRDLAWSMQRESDALGNIVLREDLLRVCTAHVARVLGDGGAAIGGRAVVSQLRERHGVLCLLGGPVYSFVHRTFLEYFVASAIATQRAEEDITNDGLAALYRRHAMHPEWAEVLELASGMITSKFMGPCLQQLVEAGEIFLAARCVEQLKERDKVKEQSEAVRDALIRIAATPRANADNDSEGRHPAIHAATLLANVWCDAPTRDALVRMVRTSSLASGAGLLAVVRQYGADEHAQAELASVTALNVGDNDIGEEGAHGLAEALRYVPQLTALDVCENHLGDVGARALAEALRYVPQLTALDVGDNGIGEGGAHVLAEALSFVPQLVQLEINHNRIGESGALAMAGGLHNVPNLMSLGVGDNGIGEDGARVLVEALCHVPQLTTLNVGMNRIGEGGARSVAESLRHVPQLTTLDVRSNRIGDGGTRALARALHHVPNLTTLSVANNSIGEDGVRLLEDALRHLPQLKMLDLTWNIIGDGGAHVLAEALRLVPQLTQLEVSLNSIGEGGIRALASALHVVPHLMTLSVASNSIGNGAARSLAEALHHVPQLTTLDVSWNEIGEDGARSLAEALRHVPQLTTLDVSWNEIGEDGRVALERAKPAGCALTC